MSGRHVTPTARGAVVDYARQVAEAEASPWFTTGRAASVLAGELGRRPCRGTVTRTLCALVAAGLLTRHPHSSRGEPDRWMAAGSLSPDASALLDFAESRPARSPWFTLGAAVAVLSGQRGYRVDHSTALGALAHLTADGLLTRRTTRAGELWGIPPVPAIPAALAS